MIDLHMGAIVEEIRPYFQSIILKRGWGYYQNEAVEGLSTESGLLLSAQVRGSKTYNVKLDLDYFPNSTCTCPHGDYCKHMAAVLFETLQMIGLSPAEFLTPQKRANKKSVVEKQSGFAKSPSKLAKISKTTPTQSDTVEEWFQYFDSIYGKYSLDYYYTIENIYDEIKNKLLYMSKDWSTPIKQIYEISVYLYILSVFSKLSDQYDSFSSYYYHHGYHFNNAWKQCFSDLVEAVFSLDLKLVMKEHKEYLEHIIIVMNKHPYSSSKMMHEWFYVYRFLWLNLLNNRTWIEQETEKVKESLQSRQASNLEKQFAFFALFNFEVMLGNDERAFKLMDNGKSENKDSELILSYLIYFAENAERERLYQWLKWSKPIMKFSGRQSIHQYLSLWQEIENQNDNNKEWLATVFYLLPYSYEYYGSWLMENKRYQEWIDFALIFNKSPEELNPVYLKEIEAQDVESLLPLYHFAVEHQISLKNRPAYKQAIRHLKKLKKYYKKLKEIDRFDQFLTYFIKKHNRLRAFQEELKKGKLVQ